MPLGLASTEPVRPTLCDGGLLFKATRQQNCQVFMYAIEVEYGRTGATSCGASTFPRWRPCLADWLKFDPPAGRMIRHRPGGSAVDRPHGLHRFGCTRPSFSEVSYDLDCCRTLCLDPCASFATAQPLSRCNVSCHGGRGGQLQFDSAAVAGTLMHGSL